MIKGFFFKNPRLTLELEQRDQVSKSYRPFPSASVRCTAFGFDKQRFIISSPDHVDLRGLYRRKVRLGYTPDVLTDASESILFRVL